jgi:hypothetical protein
LPLLGWSRIADSRLKTGKYQARNLKLLKLSINCLQQFVFPDSLLHIRIFFTQ